MTWTFLTHAEAARNVIPEALAAELAHLAASQDTIVACTAQLQQYAVEHSAALHNAEARRHNSMHVPLDPRAFGELQSLGNLDLSGALTKRLRALKRVASGGAGGAGQTPPVGALPEEHSVYFPGTSGELFSLNASQLAALASFYGEPMWQHDPPLREKRAAFARFIGAS
jgi:hypothetical protein